MSNKTYPDPGAQPVGSSNLPFYHTNENTQMAQQIEQLQNAGLARNDPALMGVGANGADFPGPGGQMPGGLDQPTSPERLARGVLGIDDDLSTPGSGRKRQKVSRACDECRRKKVRCDATPENPDKPCANCERTKAPCHFSRQPLKRGPSKGYIRELASRLDTLESQLGPHSAQRAAIPDADYWEESTPEGLEQRVGQLQEYAERQGRKRTHSQSEGALHSREASFTGARPRISNASEYNRPSYGGVGQHPLQSPGSEALSTPGQAAPHAWRSGLPESWRKDDNQAVSHANESREGDVNFTWDDTVIDECYRMIQPTYPMLPHNKARLRSRLANCPASLRQAFLLALDGAVLENPGCNLPKKSGMDHLVHDVEDLLGKYHYESRPQNLATDLVYLQTLIFMALEFDNHGPAKSKGSGGPLRTEWLVRAIGVASDLKLNVAVRNADVDSDSDQILGRRVWWTLFILDCWHACSTASLVHLPETGSKLELVDRRILGEAGYQLTRLSHILGQLSVVLQQPELIVPGSAYALTIHTSMLAQVDLIKDTIAEITIGPPGLVQLCYWHVRLLVYRLTPSTIPHDLLSPATKLASLLNSAHTTITPMNHHFAALAAMTLVELEEIPDLRSGVEKGYDDLHEAMSSRKGLMAEENSLGWDGAVQELVNRRRVALRRTISSATGLQNLADAAIGGTNNSSNANANADAVDGTTPNTTAAGNSSGAGVATNSTSTTTFDPTLLTKYGYLQALVQENLMASRIREEIRSYHDRLFWENVLAYFQHRY